MTETQSGPVLASTVNPALKPFLDAIEDDRGWANDVLCRMFREGKLEAGDVSCKHSTGLAVKHSLVANIMDGPGHDYAYQLTDLGRLYCIQYIADRHKHMKFKAGDLVTLDQIDYDSNGYDAIYKVVASNGSQVAVSLPEDWVRIKDMSELNETRVLGLIVEHDELSHATYDEEQSNERSNNI